MHFFLTSSHPSRYGCILLTLGLLGGGYLRSMQSESAAVELPSPDGRDEGSRQPSPTAVEPSAEPPSSEIQVADEPAAKKASSDELSPATPSPDALPATPVAAGAPAAGPAKVETPVAIDESGPEPVPGVRLAIYNEGLSEGTEDKSAPAKPILEDWGQPLFALFITGRQHGYLEPCGCTGLENAKGGLSRRFTFLKQLRERGWDVVAVDVGNQVRRFGKQADIKFQRTADVLKLMDYAAIGFGPDDLRLSSDGLLAPVDEGNFVAANVDIYELNASHRIVEAGGIKIGITGILGLEQQKEINRSGDVVLSDPATAIRNILPKLQAGGCRFNVLLANASLEETRQLVQQFPNSFDVVVTAGGAGEPTLEPERLAGSKSRIVQVGTKGMYVGMIGVFPDPQRPIRYGRIELTSRFPDSDEVLEIFASYQKQLEIEGLEGLGVKPVRHASGHTYVGSQVCGECHTSAYEVFEQTPHHHATESLIKPPNSRGHTPRHFDPECLSCHVTGWQPQEYLPFVSGYLSVAQKKLYGNGCENCHGPGSAHVAAENGDVDVTEAEQKKLQEEMRLTLEEAANTTCYTCHDTDNSPEFAGNFDTYWEQVEHHGVD